MKNNVITINRKPNLNTPEDFELESLYHSSFFDIVMNAKSLFSDKEYDFIINAISPAISSKFYEVDKKQSNFLIKQYVLIKKDEKDFLDKMRDVESSLDHIFKYYLKQFQLDKKESGFEIALDKNQDFYFLCEEMYKKLPTSFVFSLINIMESLKND